MEFVNPLQLMEVRWTEEVTFNIISFEPEGNVRNVFFFASTRLIDFYVGEWNFC